MSATIYRPEHKPRNSLLEQQPALPADVRKQFGHLALDTIRICQEVSSTRFDDLRDTMKSSLVGQDSAVDTVVDAISTRDLRTDSKPIASFLFLGPSGTGKTEFAKQLCKSLTESGSQTNLVRIDCSQLSSDHEVTSFLLGAPAGYRGCDNEPFLSASKFAPSDSEQTTVLLIDEIEKADEALFRLMLPMLDEGETITMNGSVTSFSNTIIIATSNLGAHEMTSALGPSLGFSSGAVSDSRGIQSIAEKAVEERFKFMPEFPNRFTKTIAFAPHTPETLHAILDKTIAQHDDTLREHRLGISLTDQAKSAIIARSSGRGGLNPRHVIHDYTTVLHSAVSKRYASGDLVAGNRLIVCHESDGLDTDTTPDAHGYLYFIAEDESLAMLDRVIDEHTATAMREIER